MVLLICITVFILATIFPVNKKNAAWTILFSGADIARKTRGAWDTHSHEILWNPRWRAHLGERRACVHVVREDVRKQSGLVWEFLNTNK